MEARSVLPSSSCWTGILMPAAEVKCEGLQQLEVVVVDLSQLESGRLRAIASGERPGVAIPIPWCAFVIGEATFTLGLGGAHVHSFRFRDQRLSRAWSPLFLTAHHQPAIDGEVETVLSRFLPSQPCWPPGANAPPGILAA